MLFRMCFLALLMINCSSLYSQQSEGPFFQASQKQPYHISVGAVLFDQNGLVACHHFEEVLGHKDIYILMRESLENGETLLQALDRGLMEEWGASAEPIAFLGCLSGYLEDPRLSFEKTTLYIACQLKEWDPNKRDFNDPESVSLIEWHEPEVLMEIMRVQGLKFNRIDADESEMLRRALPYMNRLDCDSSKALLRHLLLSH